MITGACLCGLVGYELDLEPPSVQQSLVHCHCSRCRKHHGAPFASSLVAPLSALRWLRGEASVIDYPSSSGRARRFCGGCGSVAPTPVGDRVLVPAGNLLGDLGAPSGMHVFVGSKAPWHSIADELPQHESAAPGSGMFEQALLERSGLEQVTRDVPLPGQAALEGAVPGACLCGAVAFSVSGTPSRWLQCHCSRCRRGRSAVHGSNAFYPTDQFAWRSGREFVRKYKPPEAQRFAVAFCVRCGGGTPVERDGVPFVLVPAGLFEADPGARPQAHIYVSSKAPWYTIRDGLPQFSELPPA